MYKEKTLHAGGKLQYTVHCMWVWCAGYWTLKFWLDPANTKCQNRGQAS